MAVKAVREGLKLNQGKLASSPVSEITVGLATSILDGAQVEMPAEPVEPEALLRLERAAQILFGAWHQNDRGVALGLRVRTAAQGHLQGRALEQWLRRETRQLRLLGIHLGPTDFQDLGRAVGQARATQQSKQGRRTKATRRNRMPPWVRLVWQVAVRRGAYHGALSSFYMDVKAGRTRTRIRL